MCLQYLDFYSFDYDIPGRLLLLYSICKFLYICLDNADGKQARKLGASSPLGMLFDHGCDSLSTGLFIITWMKFIKTGTSIMGFQILISGTTAFYLSTLESYFIGGLFLPIINVPSDGNFGLVLIAAGIALTGSNAYFDWTIPYTDSIPWRTFWTCFCPFSGYLNCVWNAYVLGKAAKLTEILKKTFMALLVNVTFMLAILYQGEHPEWFEHNYIFFLLSYVLCFGRLSKALMVNHCTQQNFTMIQIPVLLFIIAVNIYTAIVNFYPSVCTESGVNMFWAGAFSTFAVYW